MQEYPNGHEFLGRELWHGGFHAGRVRSGVGLLCQDIGEPGQGPPSKSRSSFSGHEGKNRSRLLEPKMNWFWRLLGFDLSGRMDRVENEIERLSEAIDELAGGL